MKLLSIVGGVPKYLEEVTIPSSVEQALSAAIFSKDGSLFAEFDRIFADVYGISQKTYRSILAALKSGPKELAEIANTLKFPHKRRLSELPIKQHETTSLLN